MNKIILIGRLTAEPEMKFSSKDTSMAITRYTLACNRPGKKDDDYRGADFLRCVAFGKAREFAMKYFHKGQRVAVEGRMQTGLYTNKDGQKVNTADVIIQTQEFADAPKAGEVVPTATQENNTSPAAAEPQIEDFIDEDEVPF